MHAKLSLSIALLACFTIAQARAQDLKQIPPPTAPFVAPVPDNADWTVTVQNPTEPPATPTPPGAMPRVDRRIDNIHSTKAGKFKRELITYVSGSIDEHWYIGALYFWTPPNQEVSVYNLNNGASNPDGSTSTTNVGSASGFAGVGWAGLKTYDKVVVFETVPCYHYTDATQGTEAWINVQTRMPVAYKNSDIFYRYKFNSPPTEQLTLPPAYDKAWKKVQLMLNIK